MGARKAPFSEECKVVTGPPVWALRSVSQGGLSHFALALVRLVCMPAWHLPST